MAVRNGHNDLSEQITARSTTERYAWLEVIEVPNIQARNILLYDDAPQLLPAPPPMHEDFDLVYSDQLGYVLMWFKFLKNDGLSGVKLTGV
jgi:hypothetical protein